MRGNPTTAVRAKELHGDTLCKLIWVTYAPLLSDDTPTALSARGIAEYLDIKRKTAAVALTRLVSLGFLTIATPATGGTAAEYLLGPRGVPKQHRLNPLLQRQQAAQQTPPDQQAA